MAGRFGYFLVGAAAIFTGMVVQGDVHLGSGHQRIVRVSGPDREIDRAVDRIVDRATDKIEIDGDDGQPVAADPATKRALADAVKELVRAEGSLIAARMDDNTPGAAIRQAEQRRDLAKQAVERIANDAKAESRGNREALRQDIRDEVRAAVRN